jgi:hypothetical protein
MASIASAPLLIFGADANSGITLAFVSDDQQHSKAGNLRRQLSERSDKYIQ